jgi:uncharacterized RDD family membrane protein YckC
VVGGAFYIYGDIAETWYQYRENRLDPTIRAQFIKERNLIRNISFGLWLLYCTYMEGTPRQGTFGKYLLGLKVVNLDGSPLSRMQSNRRNAYKIMALLPFALGFVWILFQKEKRGWHDLAGGTRVVEC